MDDPFEKVLAAMKQEERQKDNPREQLFLQLQELPDQLRQVERNLFELRNREILAQDALDAREAQLLLQDHSPVNGKNAEIREAQLHVYTHDERFNLREANQRVREVEVERNHLRNKIETLKVLCGK